jgi:hypothetical protein
MDVQQLNVTRVAAAESNPTGLWAGAPALAATTVDMVNTSGFDVLVTVTAGTVTSVKKNGVALASAAVAAPGLPVHLRPGHKLNVTYSVAPTLQWSYV